MSQGLAVDGHMLKMIPTYISVFPTGEEKGEYYALDLGGSNFRVLKVALYGDKKGGHKVLAQSKVKIPEELMTGSGDDLFDFIAAALGKVVSGGAAGPTP